MRQAAVLEATVTSKGQVTLPKKLREALRLQRGSRIRFRVEADGGLRGDPVLFELEDLWAIADQGPRPKRTMTREDMDAAKVRRRW
jgi:AbrB family looped-hinge helix DNA binding protein